MKRSIVVVSTVGVVIAGLSAGPLVAGASTRGGTQPQAPAIAELPVVSCVTSYGVAPSGIPFVARQLPTTSSVHGLSFYSNGRITVLGPVGWACGALVAADGGQKLDVYPQGKPDSSTSLAPKGAALVEVDADYTGHLPGSQLVCALFPRSAGAAAVRSSGLPCPSTRGQTSIQLTPDVVAFSDPPGVTGSGTGSGGTLSSVGAAVYPQLGFGPTDSVDVALLSCTLPKRISSLCPAIEGDFLVRNAPTFVPSSGQ